MDGDSGVYRPAALSVFFLFLLLLIVIIILTMFWWTTESRTMHILWEFSYKEHTSNQADLKGVTLH